MFNVQQRDTPALAGVMIKAGPMVPTSHAVKKLGFLVNPVAGMGGRVGLKGSDGSDILRRACELGAVPESPRRAIQTLQVMSRIKQQLEVITYPHEMGEDELRGSGFSPHVIGSITKGATTAQDTERAARELEQQRVDLILFAGGDGTARDVYRAVGQRVPTLGIPAGVKIHSAVYAVTPRHAGEVAVRFLEGKLRLQDAEVLDIDEDAFRSGAVSTKLVGYLRVPEERLFVQRAKSGGIRAEREALHGIASDVIDHMTPEWLYLVGPGTTTRIIMEELALANSLLGVDVVCNKCLVASDANENDLFRLLSGRRTTIVLSVIGGQGYLFGRGNQQFSPSVIKTVGKENIIVLATKEKLASLDGRPLLVDTAEEEIDRMLSGYIRVTTGYREYCMVRVGT